MKSKLDWNSLGQFFSTVLSLFMLIRSTFEGMRVGLQIIPWLLSEKGKSLFVEHLTAIGEEYRKTVPFEVIDGHTLLINLDSPITLPFDGAVIENVRGHGWVRLELRKGSLYLDGRKIVFLKTSDIPTTSWEHVTGSMVLNYMRRVDVLHPNVIDALVAHQHMIPAKLLGTGITAILFGATEFRSPERVDAGMSRFFGRTVLDESMLFVRSLSISGTYSLSGATFPRRIESHFECVDSRGISSYGQIAFLE